MSRKKSRQANRAPVTQPSAEATTGAITSPATPLSTAAASPQAPASAVAAPETALRITKPAAAAVATAPKAKPERAWIELAVIRVARLLGSLQLAVILLSLFTLAVFLGTLTEHWYQTKIAQTLVYKAWWFVVLLALLALNIFFAAAKKWPWKKHQTGFVITHVGLLTMLAGGMWNWAAGTDAGMQLIDNGDPSILNEVIERFGTISQSGTSAVYNDISMLRLVEYKPNEDPHAGVHHGRAPEKEVLKRTEADFEPGPLAWKTENPATPSDAVLRLMNWVENPFGRHWGTDLGNGARMEVIDYLPHAQREEYSAAPGRGFPAVKLQLRSSKFPQPLERWVGPNELRGGLESSRMPIRLEVLGTCPAPLLREFLNPPLAEQLSSKGVLAVVTPEGRKHIPVYAGLKQAFSIPGGREIKILRFLPQWIRPTAEADADAAPVNPAVEFELLEGGKSLGKYQVPARVSDVVRDMTRGKFLHQGDDNLPLFWFHSPHPGRQEDAGGKQQFASGVLQFVQTEAGALHYRSFITRNNRPVLEKAGPVSVGESPVAIWDRMQWKFRVQEHLTNAVAEPRYTPAPVFPGKETEEDKMRYQAAIKCRIAIGKDAREFWVPFPSQSPIIDVAGRRFSVQYTYKQIPLKFEIKLERAEQTVDPGTRAPASYSSYVQLFDPEKGINGERRLITMNEPLEHRGYKFYQSTYNFLSYDASGKPVSLSGFTVGRDPGLWLKYLGSLMLGLGIFCMFYMKAYFFKPRRRPIAAGQPAQEG
jgi:ResB-like family